MSRISKYVAERIVILSLFCTFTSALMAFRKWMYSSERSFAWFNLIIVNRSVIVNRSWPAETKRRRTYRWRSNRWYRGRETTSEMITKIEVRVVTSYYFYILLYESNTIRFQNDLKYQRVSCFKCLLFSSCDLTILTNFPHVLHYYLPFRTSNETDSFLKGTFIRDLYIFTWSLRFDLSGDVRAVRTGW